MLQTTSVLTFHVLLKAFCWIFSSPYVPYFTTSESAPQTNEPEQISDSLHHLEPNHTPYASVCSYHQPHKHVTIIARYHKCNIFHFFRYTKLNINFYPQILHFLTCKYSINQKKATLDCSYSRGYKNKFIKRNCYIQETCTLYKTIARL